MGEASEEDSGEGENGQCHGITYTREVVQKQCGTACASICIAASRLAATIGTARDSCVVVWTQSRVAWTSKRMVHQQQ